VQLLASDSWRGQRALTGHNNARRDVTVGIMAIGQLMPATPAVAGQQLHASVSTSNTLDTTHRLEATSTLL